MLCSSNGDYRQAIRKFDHAFNIIPDEKSNHYFYAADAALHIKNFDKAKKYIISSIEETNVSLDYINEFKRFEAFRENPLFEEINRNYSKYAAKFYSDETKSRISEELDSLITVDQEVRMREATAAEMIKTDSSNVARLIEITEKYGWQKKGWLILWHQRGSFDQANWIWNYFRPIINQEIENGNIRKSFWAQFEEFKNVYENGYQEYGLYPKNFDTYPLLNVETVDRKRDSIVLPPLRTMNKIYGWPLPKNYH